MSDPVNKTDHRIHVVSAAIVRDGRILLAQRAPDTSFPFAWCTAGGKVELGEHSFTALRRELREELGVKLAGEVDIPPILYSANLDPPVVHRALRVTCYLVEWRHVLGVPREGDKTAGLGWFSATDLRWLDLAPADAAGREHLAIALEHGR